MRGYYAIIGDRPYELPKLSLTRASKILGEETDHSEVETHPDKKSLSVNITVSNLTRETWTNKQLAEMFKEFLRKTKTTQITRLADYYTVYIEYELWDEVCGETVDHGVGVKNVKPDTFQFPLGLTDDSEYVARLGFGLSTSVVQQYRPKHPWGMMKPSNIGTEYTLIIRRIWITQLLERAWSISPNQCLHKPKPHYYNHQHYHTCNCGADTVLGQESKQWGKPYQMHDPDCGVGPVGGVVTNCHTTHPSCADVSYIAKDIMCDPKDLVVIYDTADTGDVYQTIPITFAPEEIVIRFTAKTLSPILVNREEIVELLGDIKQEIIDADVKPPVIPPSDTDDPGNTPIEGDDKDQTPPTAGDNSGTGGGTGSENSSNPTDPIEGDEKDIGSGKEPESEENTDTDSNPSEAGSEKVTE